MRTAILPGPPPRVWPWLVQMGDGRAGWYSLDLLERLAGASGPRDGRRSSWRVDPRLQHLAVGDDVPLGRGLALTVTRCRAPGRLTLCFDGPVGPGQLVFDWDFLLEAWGSGTRLTITTTMRGRPRPWGPRLVRGLLAPGHRVMEAAQVWGLRRRLVAARGGDPGYQAMPGS